MLMKLVPLTVMVPPMYANAGTMGDEKVGSAETVSVVPAKVRVVAPIVTLVVCAPVFVPAAITNLYCVFVTNVHDAAATQVAL